MCRFADFSVTLASEAFTGMSLIKRHRTVNNILKHEFTELGLHALSLNLRSVQEAQKEGLVPQDTAEKA